jgi:YD repeat-containing protein
MARDTTGRSGRGRRASHGAASRRTAARVRLLCLLVCCALLLQPSGLVAGHGTNGAGAGAHSVASHGVSLSGFAARSLLAVYAGVAGALHSMAGALPSSRRAFAASEGFNATAGGAAATEPAAVVLGAPTLSVDTTSDTSISLSWTQVSGVLTYRLERTPNLLTPYSLVTETPNNAFTDTGANLSRGRTFLYRVRAVDGSGNQSPPSAVVMATAITFFDETITAHVTVVNWQHVEDLRVAVTGIRRAALLPDPTWTEPSGHGAPVLAAHVQELRTQLNEGLAALGLPTPDFYEPTLQTGAGGTPIRKIHFDQLRERARSRSGVTGSGLSAYDFASARLDASNRTGSAGVDLVSRNFNWSLPLVGLPGRAGLDLGLSLSYNSLVWTKSGDYVLFDGDGGWPSPGFRLGFPVVQGKFADTQAGKSAYMLITPSGARVSLRQTAAGSTVYEAGDSSYLQLGENQDGTLALLTTGGTRMTYLAEGGVYKCAAVEDSNGNLINVAYNAFGNVSTVTDTLGRVLTFNYDGAEYLQSITQTWHREVESVGQPQVVTETHYWAQFNYDDKTVRTNFAGLTVFGPSNGQTVHALTQVQLADSSSYAFDYTTWGQVNKVTELSPDGHALNYVSLNLPADETAAQGDCPRFTESHVWAAYWNGDADGSPATNGSEEAVTTYGPYNFAGGVGHADAPDLTRHQETYETSGYKKGLTTQADEFSADDYQNPKKSTVFTWTQDDETLPYQQNPRVRQTDIYDSQGNHRRTDVVYTSFGLPSDVKEYDSTAQVVLRRTHTIYLPDSITSGGAYVNPPTNPTLRIIGLPSERDVYGTEGEQEKLYSKLTYDYDLPNDNTTQFLSDAGAVAQHDSTYGQGFTLRGNVCRVRRWDVTDAQNQSKAIVASEAGYNTAGSPVFSRDARSHTTNFAYADANNAGALAYPTKVTDPDTFFSTAEYNYDLGVVTRTVDPKGAAVKSLYDAAGRKLKVESETGGAYAAWEYGTNGRYGRQLSKVDTDKAETFVMSITDGAGRTLGTLRELPSSASHAYSALRFEYDKVGQQVKQYNPTEVTVNTSDISDISSWQPAGADATSNGGAGWAYSSREYDWKGRVRHEVAADRVTDSYTDYDGCGCAGGEVVTTRGEVVPIPGTSDTARRVNKVYSDSLGRPWKTEVYNWNGATVYSTTTVKYDALDHQVRVRRYAGPAPDPEPEADDASYQTNSMNYDGHGRLQSRHLPDQSAGTATAYTYFDDDVVKSVTDARGVKASFTYNARHLVTAVTYDHQNVNSVATEKPGESGTTLVTDTTAVGLTYDEAGNRLTMNDGSGSTTYHYDTMSRLTSEDKQFAGLTGTYTLSYQYALAGALKQVTDVSAGVSFSYDLDKVGQATAVNRTESGVSAQLAHDMLYRASGALKGMSYNNGTSMSLSYDARGRVTHYGVSGVTQDGQYGALAHGSDFDYYADGRVKYASDLFTDALSTRLHDRAYSYDHAGRLQEAYSGAEANQFETGIASGGEGAFRQSYTYDAFGNTKGRTGRLWSADDNDTEPFVASGRNTAWEYDPDGRLVSRNETTQNGLTPYESLRDSYDAAGRLYQTTQTTTSMTGPRRNIPHTATVTETETYDGAGLVAVEATNGTDFPSTTYYLRSTVLGGKAVSEYNGSGVRQVTHVLAGGAPIADSWNNAGTPYVNWKHVNPVTGDELDTDSGGAVTSKATLDPAGHNLGDSDPASDTTGGGDEGGTSQAQMNKMYAQTLPPSLGGDAVQAVDKAGFEINASTAFTLEAAGAGRVYFSSATEPNGTFITLVNTWSVVEGNARTTRWAPLTAVGNWVGYLPEGAVFGHQDEDYYFSLDLSEIANPGSRNKSGVFSLSDFPGTLIGEGGFQGGTQQPSQQLATLPNDRDTALDNALRNLLFRLNYGQFKKDCQEKVLDKLATNISNFNIGDFVRYLARGWDLYDGTNSQAPIAGTVTVPVAANTLYGTGATVASAFQANSGLHAMTSVTSDTFLSFFRPGIIDPSHSGVNNQNLSLLFHEALHGFTGRVDEDLQEALGLPVDPKNSKNITDYIEKHCF